MQISFSAMQVTVAVSEGRTAVRPYSTPENHRGVVLTPAHLVSHRFKSGLK